MFLPYMCVWSVIQVILESEDLHRRAYNEAFAHFNIRCNGVGDVAVWSESFYDMLQNRVGGGKQKMRWCGNCCPPHSSRCNNWSAFDNLICHAQ